MTYSQFSTENADYALCYSLHYFKNVHEDIFSPEKIKSLDAIILESGLGEYEETAGLITDSNFSNAYKIIKEHKPAMPFFFVDVKPSAIGLAASIIPPALQMYIGSKIFKEAVADMKKKTRRDFLKGGIRALIGLPLFFGFGGNMLNSLFEGKPIPVLPELSTASGYLLPAPLIEFRNAVTARKAEEFVAPLMGRRLGKKPSIALVYGPNHTGIEFDLKNKIMRDAVIGTQKDLGYWGISEKQLNSVYEYHLAPKEGSPFRSRRHTLSLF